MGEGETGYSHCERESLLVLRLKGRHSRRQARLATPSTGGTRACTRRKKEERQDGVGVSGVGGRVFCDLGSIWNGRGGGTLVGGWTGVLLRSVFGGQPF